MDITDLTFDERDEFKRKSIAEKAISLLHAEIDISPMVIDGSWGTGKTEFCHKLINLMQGNDTHHLIYIDAFKADHADEPLMTVLAEVIKVLPDENSKQSFIKKALPTVRYGLKTIAKAGVSHLLRQDIADVADDFDKEIQKTADKAIDATVEAVLKDHVKADKNLKALQAALKEITAVKPIVLFIDELDRCRPNFAVDMLEIIKHTFDVEGVKFVLITNTQQLKASINHCYGQSVDAQRYLDKFVKFTITLPETVDTNAHRESIAAIEHYKNLVISSHVLEGLKLFECGSIRTIEKIIIANRLSLREVETVVRHIEVYVTLAQSNNLQSNTVFGYKVLTILAIAIYSIQPEVALSILQKRLDAKDIGNCLGISSLSNNIQGRPDEQELICYMLGYTALHNKEHFTPTEDVDVWKEESAQYFRGSYWRTDDFASICVEAIQTLTMC
ncbi:MAG TPA: AAA family ATPase [Pseudoalteromonas sp.]|uniref:AAA family ATPase n=1 Tax=Alteromonas aestuariivivens TaxID=1938339 RepID=A0A3D8M356_9ALTE|nr:KAP family NTPase [Alteromonas aestuariivivens]RDV23985.1 AAA family ATPase [Alteromonas aestuariivivens]HCP98763.1 AAA family ATPase [Pseudoalteromonas sp.]|tara:strand:+ start:7374 stop:8711 length:1338 start_codon:yes stop_codon:yes gene_type:complete